MCNQEDCTPFPQAHGEKLQYFHRTDKPPVSLITPVSLIIYVIVITFQTSTAKGFGLPFFTQLFLTERLYLICDRDYKGSCSLVEERFSAQRTSQEGPRVPPLSCVLVKEECHSRKKGHRSTQSSGAVAQTLCPG